jgi:hypothetical protein
LFLSCVEAIPYFDEYKVNLMLYELKSQQQQQQQLSQTKTPLDWFSTAGATPIQKIINFIFSLLQFAYKKNK